jgi:hypothetical protein
LCELMSLSSHVKGKAKFSFYLAGNLYYVTESGLEFPIPITDTDGATFLAEDKAIFFMRWIRKHLTTLEVARATKQIADGDFDEVSLED